MVSLSGTSAFGSQTVRAPSLPQPPTLPLESGRGTRRRPAPLLGFQQNEATDPVSIDLHIGKGLSWMAREVKFKAQRSFEGQWEGPLMLGGSRDATLDRLEREPVGPCSFFTQEVNLAAAPAVCPFP